jgi:hypothetical protein
VTCTLCNQRKARRACPALGRRICPICCATKRLREIACPADCVHLVAAQAHPPAVVQRQRERDTSFLIGLLQGLSEPQMALLSVAQQQLRRYRPSAAPALLDSDVADAAAAMAATLETAARGIVYEHQPPSLPAQRLLSVFRQLQAEIEAKRPAPPRILAAVFRKLELASREADRHVGGGDTAFLDFADRLAAGAAAHRGHGGPDAGEGGPDRREDPDRRGHPDRREDADPPRIIIP